MNVEIVPARLEHVIEICENLRAREREAFKKLGSEPEHMVAQEVTQSFLSFAGLVEGKVINLWGAKCAGILSDEAYLWMLCSQDVIKFPMTFLRHSRRAIQDLRPHFKHFHGVVLDEFSCSIRWLEWLGFEVYPPENGLRAFRM